MAYFRVEHNNNYTVMSNYHLKDKNLSLKAKGLLSMMLSLPDEWDFSVNGLVAICKESKTAIQNTLKELEECGYLVRTRIHDEKGRIDYIYDIFEKTHSPQTENLCTVNRCTDNRPQLNTKELNTEESNTKEKKVSKTAKRQSYDEQIEAYTDNEDLRQALKAFIQMRKLIKKPLTDHALKLNLGTLNKLSNDDDIKVAIVNQSVLHDWQGFYPLKNDNNVKQDATKQETEQVTEEKSMSDFYDENGDFDLNGYMKYCGYRVEE